MRHVSRRLWATVLALGLGGCAAVNPALRERTDNLVQDFTSRRVRPVESVEGAVPMPWEEGQYVVLLTQVDGEPTLTRYAVGETTGEGVWLSIERLGYRTRERSKVLYRRQPTTLAETRTLVRRIVTTADDGLERTIDFEDGRDATVALMKDSLTAPLQILVVVPGAAAEPIAVPAGAFTRCVGATLKATLAGTSLDFTGLASAAVPVNGLVRAFSERRSASVELVEFGFDGRGSIL